MKMRRVSRGFITALRALLCAGLSLGSAANVAAGPTRVVSLNPCLDAMLVELVPRERIAAISHYSRNPWDSTIADLAHTLPIIHETAEEVVALKPDLVVTGLYSAAATRNALERVGIRVELFDIPTTIEQSHAQVRRLAELLDEPERGEALIARIDAAIASARPPAGTPRLTAAVYQPGGYTAGSRTITDDLMRIVGLENLPTRYGMEQHLPIALEVLLRSPPDLLLVGETTRGAPTQAERIVHHRALRVLEDRMTRHEYPARLLYCAGPTIIPALAALANARDKALEARGLNRDAHLTLRGNAATDHP
jgi:iron complex transport system substrate-binding protein